MLLAKRRVPILIAGLIALFTIVLLFSIGKVNAGDSTGDVTNVADFEDGLGITGTTTGWNWTAEGNLLKVAVVIGADVTSPIHEIEVFVEPTTNDTPGLHRENRTCGR